LEIAGLCTYPEDRLWGKFFITVHGNQPDQGDFNARLQEFHVKDKNGDPKYRKLRGYHQPVDRLYSNWKSYPAGLYILKF
jgi:hypothetical protein